MTHRADTLGQLRAIVQLLASELPDDTPIGLATWSGGDGGVDECVILDLVYVDDETGSLLGYHDKDYNPSEGETLTVRVQ